MTGMDKFFLTAQKMNNIFCVGVCVVVAILGIVVYCTIKR